MIRVKSALYGLIKKTVRLAFHCYYKKIKMVDMHKVPRDRAVLFLPNHQNTLMDPLLIAAFSNRKPYFLTRSDVFVNPVLNRFFEFLRMIPIYRIRDGRRAVPKNEAIFESCARKLANNNALLIFPEGNHHIRKFVRPLSKGFTRILRAALDKDPGLDIALVPVGINYQASEEFPDRTTFLFDDPVSLGKITADMDWNSAIPVMKEEIYSRLTQLTTHIEPEEHYAAILSYLRARDTDFTNPVLANQLVQAYKPDTAPQKGKSGNLLHRLTDGIFFLVNLPVLLPWRGLIKKRIEEIEFLSTYRFAYALGVYPLYYAALFALFSNLGTAMGILAPVMVFLHNLAYVKLR